MQPQGSVAVPGGEALDAQHHGAGCVRAEHRRRDRLAGHEGRERGVAGRRRRHRAGDAARPQDGDAVCDRKHLVELVADEDNGTPVIAQLPQQRGQLRDLRRRQHRRGLIEDQHVGAAEEQAQNFYDLPDVHRRRLGRHVPRHGDAGLKRERDGGGAGARAVDDAAARHRFVPEDQVFEQREARDQHELLVHHADAARERIGRPRERDRFPIDDHRARVGPVDALQDAHQRGLAGAVAADHRVDRTARDRQVDAVIGEQRAEAPRDAACAEARRVHLKKAG